MDEPKLPLVDILLRLLKAIRIKENLTLEQVSEKAGIHRTHLGLLEKGERHPSLDVASQIATALGFNLSELLLKAELINAGKLDEEQAFREAYARVVPSSCLRNQQKLNEYTGLTGEMLIDAIQGCYSMLDTIDTELVANGSPPIARLVELANLSSMVGNMVGGAIAEASDGLYARNKPHHYPDLLPQHESAKNLELKMALETNRPKGHLPKPGNYITFRYVLGDRSGNFVRGKENRGDTVWVWEIKVGSITVEDFDISNTPGDSGKTAVLKSKVFNEMPLVYFDPTLCPFAMRNSIYPGLN